MSAAEFAKRIGWERDRLPWFGLFFLNGTVITVISDHRSDEAINIALEEGRARLPNRAFCVRWFDSGDAVAGFVPK